MYRVSIFAHTVLLSHRDPIKKTSYFNADTGHEPLAELKVFIALS